MNKDTSNTYLQKRVYEELGINEEQNKIKLKTERGVKFEKPIFSSDDNDNIKILVYDLNRNKISYPHPKATPEKPNIFNDRDLTYYITRLKNPITLQDGHTKKYDIPKGQGTYPFITPGIINKYEQKEKIKTLVLTEGYFKAFKAYIHGLDIIGLPSITCYKEKESKQIYRDIRRVIEVCGVENLIMLYDGDCRDISVKSLDKGDDLYKRPYSFFSSAKSIQELLKDYEKLSIYFAHIISDSVEGNPKGLDDMLCSMQGKEMDVIKDITSFSKKNIYVYKENITYSLAKLQRYMHIKSADDFYEFHADKIKNKEFIFNGTKYQWDESKNEGKGELIIKIPGAAKFYFRVGDQYHELVSIPNKYGDLEKVVHQRQKQTIIDDHGKKFIEHISKYKAFCNVPSHENYQQVIHNCYNMYAPFEHLPEKGTCETTLEFLKHIFADQIELGLDYLQLLYQQPTQILPILCLISKENSTGKTTFAKWLKVLFSQNMTILGNSALKSNFNAAYASKLIICCDETYIDKKEVLEMIKSLSTADRILLNAKQKTEVEIEFFGKFILLSNNEDNFIFASKDDIRYWVIKVPVPVNPKYKLLNEMVEEIPAFIDMLNQRKISTECKSRMWFSPGEIETEALRNIIENSKTQMEKELREKLKNMFIDFGNGKLYLTTQMINERILSKKYQDFYIRKILKEAFKVDYYKNKEGKQVVKTCYYPYWDYNISSDEKGNETKEMVKKHIRYVGRAFEFDSQQFLSEEEKQVHYELDS